MSEQEAELRFLVTLEQEQRKTVIRGLRRALAQRGGALKVLRGIEAAAFEAHMQGRIHGTKAFPDKSGDVQRLICAAYSKIIAEAKRKS